jgi:hypothetical protein
MNQVDNNSTSNILVCCLSVTVSTVGTFISIVGDGFVS